MNHLRVRLVLSTLAVSICGSTLVFGQATPATDFTVPPGSAAYVNARPVNGSQINPAEAISGVTLAMPPNGASIFANSTFGRSSSPGRSMAHNPRNSTAGTIDGLTTASTFAGAFAAQAGPFTGFVFPFIMLGNHPAAGGTTTFTTNIAEVSLTLLNADGTVLTTVPFAPFEALTLNSPNFQDSRYSSSPSPTQFADAVQRAEFFSQLQPGMPWHTRLSPLVVNRVNITVPRFVNVRLADGTVIQARSYFIGTAADGSTFVLMLDLLFNFFFVNEAVDEINLGNFQTDALNVTAFPNTFLFSLNVASPNTPGGCCVLGFHTLFFDPSVVPQPNWLTLFASWISPGVFGGGFGDVTALSHEISETFDNPLLINAAPNWQFPGQPANSTACQNNLETGDPIEVLPNATFPVTIDKFTYHPQNEALRQWFEMGATSNAIGGAFSYPNTALLPHSAVPCPQ